MPERLMRLHLIRKWTTSYAFPITQTYLEKAAHNYKCLSTEADAIRVRAHPPNAAQMRCGQGQANGHTSLPVASLILQQNHVAIGGLMGGGVASAAMHLHHIRSVWPHPKDMFR